MIKDKILIALGLLLFISCCNFNWMNGSDPGKRSFKYYNKKFAFDRSSNLKLDQKYVMYDNTGVDLLIFFKDGFLNIYPTIEVNSINCLRRESGVIMGYFPTGADCYDMTKIFFNCFYAAISKLST